MRKADAYAARSRPTHIQKIWTRQPKTQLNTQTQRLIIEKLSPHHQKEAFVTEAPSSFLSWKQTTPFQTHLFLPYSDTEGAYTENLISFYIWNVLQDHNA